MEMEIHKCLECCLLRVVQMYVLHIVFQTVCPLLKSHWVQRSSAPPLHERAAVILENKLLSYKGKCAWLDESTLWLGGKSCIIGACNGEREWENWMERQRERDRERKKETHSANLLSTAEAEGLWDGTQCAALIRGLRRESRAASPQTSALSL